MKIYVASHDVVIARKVAKKLEQAGHVITSRWLQQKYKPIEKWDEKNKQRIAAEDYNDVMDSDVLILISGNKKYPGGKFVEAGIALGVGIRIIVLGHRENMLLWHPSISIFKNINEIVQYLEDFIPGRIQYIGEGK